jgi:hypothetical protein
MAPDYAGSLIVSNEPVKIRTRLCHPEKELQGSGQQYRGEIYPVLHKVLDRQP